MKMHSVRSSNIIHIGHEGDTLRVTFGSGQTWEYDGVPAHEFAQFLNSKSIGAHFHAHIRGSKMGRKVEDGE